VITKIAVCVAHAYRGGTLEPVQAVVSLTSAQERAVLLPSSAVAPISHMDDKAWLIAQSSRSAL
jgi:hypothetical protein